MKNIVNVRPLRTAVEKGLGRRSERRISNGGRK